MLLDTAERLFGSQSMHEVSLRAVARELVSPHPRFPITSPRRQIW
jgi:hypothetical protein